MTIALHALSLAEAARRFRAGQLSSVDLVEACLAQVDAREPQLNAFITVGADQARQAALEADAEMRVGLYRGPLHGIPIAHKDMLQTAGVRTTAGSALLQDWVPTTDAEVVRELKVAGAISLGKTQCHEFAFGCPMPDDLFPAARNPWNPEHMPGSSSSGSGAAVAAGMVMAATGTDTGGSIRHPAAACGLVGLKPTYGLVSLAGVIPLAPSMDHVGPLTRSVADNALMLQAMLKPSMQDLGTRIGQPIDGLSIGIPWQQIEVEPHDAEVLAAFEKALSMLQSLGARLVRIEPSGLSDAAELANLIIAYEASLYHAENLERQPNKLGSALKLRLAKGCTFTQAQYLTARAQASALKARYTELFSSGIEVVMSPGREFPAETMAALMAAPTGRRSTCNRVYSLTGSPALTLPMGLNAQGLPLALQMACAHFQEPLLYQVAAAYEAAAGWRDIHPENF